jgi:hypothetical protein
MTRKLSKQELKRYNMLNKTRKELGLSLLQIKIRKCNKCNNLFESFELRSCCASQVNAPEILQGYEVLTTPESYNFFKGNT